MPAVADRETVRAQARYVRSSARKARLVLEHIRGKSAMEARTILAFETRAIALEAGKVLASAIANAENNNGHEPDDLVVVAAFADEGPTLKRWRPRARGRVNRINKRTCHITIQLAVAEPGEIKHRPEKPKPVRETPARKPRGKAAVATPVEPVDEAVAETEVVEPAETVAEPTPDTPAEKPKPARKPRAKKPAEPKAAAVEPAADEPADESEPEVESTPEPVAEAETPAEQTDEEKSE
jgi:large subunit ribosomal protein L22